jgi:hypothetical protein
MGNIYSAYDQLATILARLGPEEIMKLKASDEMQKRLELLLNKSRNNAISLEEKDELDHYLVLERLVRLAKIRSYQGPNEA